MRAGKSARHIKTPRSTHGDQGATWPCWLLYLIPHLVLRHTLLRTSSGIFPSSDHVTTVMFLSNALLTKTFYLGLGLLQRSSASPSIARDLSPLI